MGTWDGRKRGRFLHDVFQRVVRPQVPDAQLWLVADRAEPGDGVTWFESPTDEELAELLRQAWVFCLPSTYEGFGIPYLEAMARGVPVVASYNPGAVDILAGGEAGRIVEDHSLGEALVSFLTKPALSGEYAARGARRAATFAWDRILDDYEVAYELAIERFTCAWRRKLIMCSDLPSSCRSRRSPWWCAARLAAWTVRRAAL